MRGWLVAISVGPVQAVSAGPGTGSILSGVSIGRQAGNQLYDYGQR